MIRVGIVGAAGRMGQALLAALADDSAQSLNLVLSGAFVRPGSTKEGKPVEPPPPSLEGATAAAPPLFEGLRAQALQRSGSQVVIDFGPGPGVRQRLALYEALRLPLLLASTGLEDGAEQDLERLHRSQPILPAANTSLGIAVLCHLVKQAAGLLQDFDIEVTEMHHRHKRDAPSGTAWRLAQAAQQGRPGRPQQLVSDRCAQPRARQFDEIGIAALRGGGVFGEHTVVLAHDSERVELTHRAHNRGLFAEGALRAAAWLANQRPGRYRIEEAFGLRSMPSD